MTAEATNTSTSPASQDAPSGEGAGGATTKPDAGLLEGVKPTPDTPANPDPNASTAAHIAEDPTKAAQERLAQKRERPATVPEKFWDKEKGEPKVEDLGKSYTELEKSFKLGKHKPPADGKYDRSALGAAIPDDDPVLAAYTGWANKYGLSQAAYEELASSVLELAGGATQETAQSKQKEMAALGEQAPAIIDSMVTWARSFVSSGVWTNEDFEEFKVMGGTANGMRALMRVRESYEGRIPLKDTIPTDLGISDDELKARVGHPDYATNKDGYRDKTEKLFERRYGTAKAA